LASPPGGQRPLCRAPRQPAYPAAVALAAPRRLPPSGADRQTDCPLRGGTRSCPSAPVPHPASSLMRPAADEQRPRGRATPGYIDRGPATSARVPARSPILDRQCSSRQVAQSRRAHSASGRFIPSRRAVVLPTAV